MKYLPKEEMQDITDILRHTCVPCESYWAKYDAVRRSKVFSKKHTDQEQKDILNTIGLFIGLFPKGNIKSFNPNAYAAALYALLCLENRLSQKGVVWFLQRIQRSHKQLPAIAEINSSLTECNLQYDEFNRSYEHFMQMYLYAEESLIKRLDNEGISISLSDILDIRQLIQSWHTLLPYNAFLGCDISIRPSRPDKITEMVIHALSKPRHENPLLMVCLVMIEIAKKDKITQYNSGDIYREMARLYPDVPLIHGKAFYLPSQWRRLNLDAIKPDYGHETELFDYDELILGLIDPAYPQTEMMNYIRKVTYDYFSIDQMFE